jgi:hypothetical protein
MSPAPALDFRLLTRVRGEYREMPGLTLTFGQACRLWQVDATTCEAVLQRLLAEGFLVKSASGAYAARSAPARARSGRWPSAPSAA